MSNIGKKLIPIPKGTTLTFDKNNQLLKAEGILGILKHKMTQGISIDISVYETNRSKLKIESKDKILWGCEHANITNLINGVTYGFQNELNLVGIGYRATIKDNNLILKLGYSHDISYLIPNNIKIICPKQNKIIIFGTEKKVVNQFSNEIRNLRKPDSYLGKGIIFEGETLNLKERKKK